MKIITGPPVAGDNYFFRKKLAEEAWNLIESGCHILITAPRRVGKTSFMYYLKDHPKKGYCFIYLNTESVNNENEFFRRLVNKIVTTEHIGNSQKIVTFIKKNIPSIKRVGPDGIEFTKPDEKNFKEMLVKILQSIQSDNIKLIVMLDEFPQTLINIIEDEGESQGKHFLRSNREIRQDIESSKNVQFIYAGSIGLENIVSRLNAVATINDLARLIIPPLIINEVNDFIDFLLKNTKFTLSHKLKNYILKKIEWLIPFYIQLVISELNNIYRDEDLNEISVDIIDRAFVDMLEQRNHFEHWHTRLRTSFKGKEYSFIKEVLNTVSDNNIIKTNEINDLAVKYDLVEFYRDLLKTLTYDGYLNNNDNPKIYRFNSPILKMWWKNYVAN
ncbi:hypothetical protein AMJ80_08355 [bacterium SM23_31]|nr:MAG: hypothetical protein AMJ80_08355 [bacterium SM23_31]